MDSKSDADDNGFHILMDQEIIASIQEQDNSEGEDEEENDEPIPSHSRAVNYLEIPMKWYEKQDERDAAQLLSRTCETYQL